VIDRCVESWRAMSSQMAMFRVTGQSRRGWARTPWLIALAVALLLYLGSRPPAFAEPPDAPPPGMTQQQFDALVDAISKSVAEKLKSDAKPASAPAQARPASSIAKSLSAGPDSFSLLFDQGKAVVAAIPSVGRQLRYVYGLLDRESTGGLSAGGFLACLLSIAVLAVACEVIIRRLMHRLQQRLAVNTDPRFGIRSFVPLIAIAMMDVIAVSMVWVVGRAGAALLIAGSPEQHRLAHAILLGIVGWRFLALAFRIVLRPDLPEARLCDVEDGPAGWLQGRISVSALILIVGRMLGQLMEAVGTPALTVSAYQAVAVPAYVAFFLWLVVGSRDAFRQWLMGLGQSAPLAAFVGRHWVPIGGAFFVAAGLTQWHGIVSGHLHVGNATLATLNVVMALLLFETLMQAVVRRLDSQLTGYTPASATPKLPDVLARCLRVAVLIIAAAVVAESWVVHVFGLIDEKDWDRVTQSSRTAGVSLFIAYVLWELFKYVTDPYVLASPSGAAAGSPATRLHTMMRLLRTAVAIILFVVAAMIALDDFGVNITPLIAGASVFGIAISFGSQALVKDIVSGIFYLYDDAFRVGEYIDCGRAAGTVEGFTLRSIRLRNQNGQVHTIPFGDLGQITNFSRDWATRKFTLRFPRDTNLDNLRKVTQEIGAEMLETAGMKDQIIEPLKMSGIEEVTDNALVIRFKFVARPGSPGGTQDDAIVRLLHGLPERGIEFAR
jgi:small-conductance mechanosensitive channel